MAYNHAPEGESLVVGGESGAFLIVHLAERSGGDLGVVGRMGIAGGEVGVAVFEVGQVDVDVRGDPLQDFDAVVAAGVPDNGRVEAASM